MQLKKIYVPKFAVINKVAPRHICLLYPTLYTFMRKNLLLALPLLSASAAFASPVYTLEKVELYGREGVEIVSVSDTENPKMLDISGRQTLDGVEYDVLSIREGAFSQLSALEILNIHDYEGTYGDWLEEYLNSLPVASVNGIAYGTTAVSEPFNIDGVSFRRQTQFVYTLVRYPADALRPSYEVPGFVSDIAEGAFSDARYLQEVTFHPDLSMIGQDAFAGSGIRQRC